MPQLSRWYQNLASSQGEGRQDVDYPSGLNDEKLEYDAVMPPGQGPEKEFMSVITKDFLFSKVGNRDHGFCTSSLTRF